MLQKNGNARFCSICSKTSQTAHAKEGRGPQSNRSDQKHQKSTPSEFWTSPIQEMSKIPERIVHFEFFSKHLKAFPGFSAGRTQARRSGRGSRSSVAMGTRSPSESVDEQRAEDSGSGKSETDSSSDPDSEDSGSAAFAQRVHPAEQFRAERGEAEDVDRSDRGNARRERPCGSKTPNHL